IQIATVVVVEPEAMSLGAGHVAAGLADEEEVLTFDDDRVGNAARHRGAAVSDETFVLVLWLVLFVHSCRGRKVRASLNADAATECRLRMSPMLAFVPILHEVTHGSNRCGFPDRASGRVGRAPHLWLSR